MAGRGGVRITWDDGSVSEYPAGARLTDASRRRPLRIEGRVLQLRRGAALGFEAPILVPTP